MGGLVRSAYGKRAEEYAEVLGSLEAVAAEDQSLVTRWAQTLSGPVIDAGCGPGHWTKLLHDCGVDVHGIDLVPEFITAAGRRFPGVSFGLGDLAALPVQDAGLGGVLSWYSIIHAQPEVVPAVAAELHRVLRPGGSLLLGFFRGEVVAPFDHAVTAAYCWPAEAMGAILIEAGFSVRETHAREDAGARPHAAIWAMKPSV